MNRPDLHGLLRAGRAAQDRKHRELAMLERVQGLSRVDLEQECDAQRIEHAGHPDELLRQSLISTYRRSLGL